MPELNNENHVFMSNLTFNQMKFCHTYVSNGCNLSKACETVGISRPTAYSYLKMIKINKYIKVLTDLGTKENIASTQELLQVLSDIAMGKTTDQIFDFKAGKVVEILPSAISRTKSIELILKHRGELNQKVELTQNNLYLNAPADKLDLTALIEGNKEIIEIPADIDFEEVGGIDE